MFLYSDIFNFLNTEQKKGRKKDEFKKKKNWKKDWSCPFRAAALYFLRFAFEGLCEDCQKKGICSHFGLLIKKVRGRQGWLLYLHLNSLFIMVWLYFVHLHSLIFFVFFARYFFFLKCKYGMVLLAFDLNCRGLYHRAPKWPCAAAVKADGVLYHRLMHWLKQCFYEAKKIWDTTPGSLWRNTYCVTGAAVCHSCHLPPGQW